MNEIKIKWVNIDAVIPYENNPRINDDAVIPVANSIKEFGFKNPIIIDKDNVIIAGHTRLKASKHLGLEKVPVIVADDLTPDQVKAFRIADNKVGELAIWDNELLEIELENIELDMSAFDLEVDVIDDDEMLDINDENLENTLNNEYKLTFGKKAVVMTESEYNQLLDKFNEYTEEYGVTFGFVRWLLNE